MEAGFANSPTGLFVRPFYMLRPRLWHGVIVVEFPNGQRNIWKISPSPKIPFVRCFRETREREREREERVLSVQAEETRDLGGRALFSRETFEI